MAAWLVPNLVEIATSRGVSLVSLGFLQAAPDGTLAWADLASLSPTSTDEQAVAINRSIREFQAVGGA